MVYFYGLFLVLYFLLFQHPLYKNLFLNLFISIKPGWISLCLFCDASLPSGFGEVLTVTIFSAALFKISIASFDGLNPSGLNIGLLELIFL